MATDSNAEPAASEGKPFLLDPYKEWANGEGIPIHLDFGHDLIALPTGPWARYDARGCFAFTHGAGDFMSNYVLEVPPGRKTRPLRHLFVVPGLCPRPAGQVRRSFVLQWDGYSGPASAWTSAR